MQKTVISTPLGPQAIGPYSQAVRAGNLVFVSGQIPPGPVDRQTHRRSVDNGSDTAVAPEPAGYFGGSRDVHPQCCQGHDLPGRHGKLQGSERGVRGVLRERPARPGYGGSCCVAIRCGDRSRLYRRHELRRHMYPGLGMWRRSKLTFRVSGELRKVVSSCANVSK